MAAPSFPSPGRMDAWQEKHRLQTMNLRSVFTVEQQNTLERYYDNGMTNQSKACFQLILQCAQETKLDFSVVRTWVGNKRRKLASKADQNGSLPHSFADHGLSGGVLSNHTLAGGTLSDHRLAGSALVAGSMLTAEMAAARSIQRAPHLLPPSTFRSSSSSSSPSSSSPLSSGNNNDVILTGIYSINSASRSRSTLKPLLSDSELPAHARSALLNQSVHNRNSSSSSSPLHSRLASLTHKPSALSSPPGPSVYSGPSRGGRIPTGEARLGVGAGIVPPSWARQYGPVPTRPWPSLTQSQLQPHPNSNPQPQPAPPALRVSPPNPNPRPPSNPTLLIQQVFTLSDRGEEEGPAQRPASERRNLSESKRQIPRPLETIGCFSIAMETGDEEDEWRREEELASVNSQTHRDIQRGHTSGSLSPPMGEVSGARGDHTAPFPSSRPEAQQRQAALRNSYSHTALHTSPTNTPQETPPSEAPVSQSAPWLSSNSRKRTLQDRTQFSDSDLLQLKRYWDRGMTSLGSVCREKIAAAANQLNVDAEIIKTWISNRRRKYRLMAIEIPPPKGGPAVFGSSSPGHESPLDMSPEGEGFRTPELGEDLIDGGSLCLSEDGTSDSYQREGEEGAEQHNMAPLAENVKTECIAEYEEEDDDGDEMMASDMDHMRNLLEYKHEEVHYLESELENQKQKYYELERFTKSLLNAVRNNDQEKQQELLASLPQSADQDWDTNSERGGQPAAMTTLSNADGLPSAAVSNDDASLVTVNKDLPLITINEDGSSVLLNETSASEEQGTETGPE
ncbi:highly divergent homeobox [Osmerus eperlanus]|uniref:highly divergent homeobox n=1 Tax=Osmerus eperlanus TaxID=29151 RepID=UPI002E0FDDE6